MLGIDAIYVSLRQIVSPAVEGAQVDIAEMYDAIAIKLLWQIGHIDGEVLHLKLSDTLGKAIDEAEECHDGQHAAHQFAPVA